MIRFQRVLVFAEDIASTIDAHARLAWNRVTRRNR